LRDGDAKRLDKRPPRASLASLASLASRRPPSRPSVHFHLKISFNDRYGGVRPPVQPPARPPSGAGLIRRSRRSKHCLALWRLIRQCILQCSTMPAVSTAECTTIVCLFLRTSSTPPLLRAQPASHLSELSQHSLSLSFPLSELSLSLSSCLLTHQTVYFVSLSFSLPCES
jgi:hypothetical protein